MGVRESARCLACVFLVITLGVDLEGLLLHLVRRPCVELLDLAIVLLLRSVAGATLYIESS